MNVCCIDGISFLCASEEINNSKSRRKKHNHGDTTPTIENFKKSFTSIGIKFYQKFSDAFPCSNSFVSFVK